MMFLKLVRFPNLIIVALTQFFLQAVVRLSIRSNLPIELVLNNLQFAIFVLATVCVTAAGYIINDIYDIDIDAHNKPEYKQIVGRQISKRRATLLYFILIGFGSILSFEVANVTNHFDQLWLLPTFVFGLWLYAAHLKKSFLLGNLFVAIFCAAVAWIIFYAQNLNSDTRTHLNPNSYNQFFFIFFGYSILAFISTLLREIIKDAEDANGDAQFGARTLPIVLGIAKTKFICYALALIFITTIIYFGFIFKSSMIKFTIWQTTNFFVFYLCYFVYKANSPNDWHTAATFAKVVMLVGLIFVLLLLI